MADGIRNQLTAIRKRRGVGAADLARRAGVSRQTIYAMEAGNYVPNTEVSLKLARALEVPVEEIFSLAEEAPKAPAAVPTRVLSARATAKGQAARLCRMGEQWVSVPVSAAPYYLPEADGVLARPRRTGGKASLKPLGGGEQAERRVVMAGCDPATSLLVSFAERLGGVEVIPAAASSRLALQWLAQGAVHIAGTHLQDAESGEFNLPYLRRAFPGEDLTVVTFAEWEEGLVTAANNPKGIRAVEHLANPAVRFVNRETGSGARALLESLLLEAGVPGRRVRGYGTEAPGHLAAAYAIVTGEADCCLATRSAAQAFGLGFVPLRRERYDLVMRRETRDLPAVQGLLDVLQRVALRRKLEVLAGYETRATGSVVA